jgi:hypothetical protein
MRRIVMPWICDSFAPYPGGQYRACVKCGKFKEAHAPRVEDSSALALYLKDPEFPWPAEALSDASRQASGLPECEETYEIRARLRAALDRVLGT